MTVAPSLKLFPKIVNETAAADTAVLGVTEVKVG